MKSILAKVPSVQDNFHQKFVAFSSSLPVKYQIASFLQSKNHWPIKWNKNMTRSMHEDNEIHVRQEIHEAQINV